MTKAERSVSTQGHLQAGCRLKPGLGHRAENCITVYYHCFLHRDQNERSPLHLAASKGSTRCCEAILQKYQDCINMLDRNKVTNSFH